MSSLSMLIFLIVMVYVDGSHAGQFLERDGLAIDG